MKEKKSKNKGNTKFSGFGKIRVRGHINYREIVLRFERQSTFHGISHAALASNTKWRIIWYTAFIICFCALLIQIILLIRRYRTYPKSVDLDLKFENAPFPSITFCNINPYKASMIAKEGPTKAMMDAFSIAQNHFGSFGISAAVENARKEAINSRQARAVPLSISNRRYHQASVQCLCEINSLTGERKKGSCLAAYKGNVSIQFTDALARFYPSKCICQLDWVSKTLWPCFPHKTWNERLCKVCLANLGHCPMKFFEGKAGEEQTKHPRRKECLCHREYNHCIANNEYGYILEIKPTTDIFALNISEFFIRPTKLHTVTTTVTTITTQTTELKKALGFEGLTDEITIKQQAKENLMFAVNELNYEAKVEMSQRKDELILKCSFNQRDCDIENDFKLHYDQTYGNCYTFNWNRTKQVTAHQAGANFGLRVLLYADTSEYLPTSESVGFRITIHDKWVMPFPDAFGYNAPTGFLSAFGVRMKKFNRLVPPHGQCLKESKSNLDTIYPGFNYSTEGCHRTCTQKEVSRICGCANPAYPIPNTAKPCKVSDRIARECIKNATLHSSRLISEGNLADCVCHQPCSEVNYEVTYSAARWPSGTTKVMECDAVDDLCMERYRRNAAMIQVFYEELNYETLTETPAYTLTSALADLGGLTGLWIGASVVSLMEILALIVYTIQAYVRKRKRQPSVYPRYVKRSLSSLSSPLSTVSSSRTKVIRMRTPSNRSQISKESLISEKEEMKEDEDNLSHKKSKYLPPGVDLPCECIYENGKIQLMNALCPEHGYMVRRKENSGLYFEVSGFSDADYEEENEDEMNESGEEKTTEEKNNESSEHSNDD
ncbi:amiloride-sensitive sodium channel [Loa loa]|uniref:Amiloride-sensitive sodium channel n=1 Tax=Loa loa TaxID=7209 RepID=A0A1S0UBG0_LOALO|nr:amiloride-sensitive sodium channel [Loa loa]EFO27882.2 amiloride-sensitive sodium channel [Loa loa]